MKKSILFGLLIMTCLILTGCGKESEKNILSDLSKKIDKIDGYHLSGELQIVNNEDSYIYDVEVGYAKENKFRVSLKNKTNNHEQIILRNTEGIYVLTPSLNKSFKFQSEWPYNNSQAYLLQTVLKDIENDENRLFEQNDLGYLFTTTVNYTNNKNLVKQRVQFDKDLNIKEVVIVDENDILQMKMAFNDIDYKATHDETYFALGGSANNASNTSNTLDSIVYPMYLPKDTHLTGQEKIALEDGERVILTFSGSNPFVLVQETITPQKSLLTIPVYGEPYVVTGTVGALSESSITWMNEGVEYYVVSGTLNQQQLLEIANSVNVKTISKQ